MIAITMPQPSHYMTDGTVTHWYNNEGDPVQEGEPLVEIEAIKGILDIPAPATGTLGRIYVQVGE